MLYLRLNHQCPFLSHFAYEGIDVQSVLHFHPLQHAVQDNECPRSSDPCTTVHYQRRGIVVREILPDPLYELDEAGLVCGDSMIGPGREVKMGDIEWFRVHLCRLKTLLVIHNTKLFPKLVMLDKGHSITRHAEMLLIYVFQEDFLDSVRCKLCLQLQGDR